MNFAELPLDARLLEACAAQGFVEPTPIQARAIPLLLEGRDVVGRARTGSGKTAAFGLPMLHTLAQSQKGGVSRQIRGLVLVPTRELALQVQGALSALAEPLGQKVISIFGGSPYLLQYRALASKPSVVVGTPGRLLDHIARGTLDLGSIEWVVLDEADEMLRMGFVDDVQSLLEKTPRGRVTALFSATMPPPIRAVADTHLRNPVEVEVEGRKSSTDHIEQRFLRVSPDRKLDVLLKLLKCSASGATLVFARTRAGCAEVADSLARASVAVEALHGDLDQQTRERVVGRLRAGVTEVVVATDVAARGLDIPSLSRVINYDLPDDIDTYVHRIGRTGRAGQAGLAYSFVTRAEGRKVLTLERTFGRRFEPFPEPSEAQIAAAQRSRIEAELIENLPQEDLERALAYVHDLIQRSGVSPEQLAAATLLRLCDMKGVEIPSPAAPERPRRAEVQAEGRAVAAPEARQESAPQESAPQEGEPQESAQQESAQQESAQQESAQQESAQQESDQAELSPSEEEQKIEETEQIAVFLPVGRRHGVRKGDLASAFVGIGIQGVSHIKIGDAKSFVRLPVDTVEALLARRATVEVAGSVWPVVKAHTQHREHHAPRKHRSFAHG